MIKAAKQFLKIELTGWKKSEIIRTAVSCAVIIGLSLYWGESSMGIITALTGVLYVIFGGKGKRTAFIFGTINVLLYAYTSFAAKYYGEVMLNLIYYFPMNFVGWTMWKKHMNTETGEVVKKRLPSGKRFIIYACTAAAIFIYGMILKKLGGNLPYIDSMSTVISVTAQILTILRLTEQWILWIVVDAVTIIMWSYTFITTGEGISMVVMWTLYLINGIIILIHWNRELKQNKQYCKSIFLKTSDKEKQI